MGKFRRASRKAGKIRLAIDGPSGSGKTHSALLIASGLIKHEFQPGKVDEDGQPLPSIALIDTEKSSSELEVGKPGIPAFLHANLEAPYSPQRYIEAIRDAGREVGPDGVVIVDSVSHAWFAEGGELEMVDKASKGLKGNTWAAWRDVTPEHNALVDAILQCPAHIFCTLRTKSQWETTKVDGRTVIRKVGTKPIQRDGLEYEFTVVMEMVIDGHVANTINGKDRTSLFDGKYFVPDAGHGTMLRDWLSGALDPNAESTKMLADITERLRGAVSRAHLKELWIDTASDRARLNSHDAPRLQAAVKAINDGLGDDTPTAEEAPASSPPAAPAPTATREPDPDPGEADASQVETPAPSGESSSVPDEAPPADPPPAETAPEPEAAAGGDGDDNFSCFD